MRPRLTLAVLACLAAAAPANLSVQQGEPAVQEDGSAPVARALSAPMPAILPLRDRARVVDRWLEQRLETVVPMVMRRHGVDMWIVAAREYNEDPVIETMLPATWMAARRRTVLVFHDRGPEEGVERLAVENRLQDILTAEFRTGRTGNEIRIMLEEDAFFDGRSVRYMDGRQTKLHLIPRDAGPASADRGGG